MTKKTDNRARLVLVLLVANLGLTLGLLLRTSPAAVSRAADSQDITLLKQADALATRIKAVGKIRNENAVEAARLWRESQLTLVADMVDGDSKEFESLASVATDLQHSLAKTIPPLVAEAYANARQEHSLRSGLARWAAAGAYLALLPNDGTPSVAETAQKMGYDHESVHQELLQKAQTKYNLWACEQIKKAWVDIKEVNSPVSKSDNMKFFHSCVHFLSPINSRLLDMSTGMLYREVLQFVRDRMPLKDFQELIKEIENGDKRSLDNAK